MDRHEILLLFGGVVVPLLIGVLVFLFHV